MNPEKQLAERLFELFNPSRRGGGLLEVFE